MHVMFIPSWYDNNRNKVHGSFFREQATKLQESGVKVTVAYNEIWPLTLIGKVKEKSGLSFNVEKGLRLVVKGLISFFVIMDLTLK